jgi:hypothetical protein
MSAEGLKVLHLTLHRKWFDAIQSGEKKEEYREAKPYYYFRLAGRAYDEVLFVNGYGKDRPFMRVECLGIRFDYTVRRWVIQLGEILEVGNV